MPRDDRLTPPRFTVFFARARARVQSSVDKENKKNFHGSTNWDRVRFVISKVDQRLVASGGGGDGVWGTLFAPYAHVTASAKIEGGVIARSFDFSGSSINPSRSFDGIVTWD